jgi:hypothetical protein
VDTPQDLVKVEALMQSMIIFSAWLVFLFYKTGVRTAFFCELKQYD